MGFLYEAAQKLRNQGEYELAARVEHAEWVAQGVGLPLEEGFSDD